MANTRSVYLLKVFIASDAKILYSVNFWGVLVLGGGRVHSLTLHVGVHKSAHIILGVRL